MTFTNASLSNVYIIFSHFGRQSYKMHGWVRLCTRWSSEAYIRNTAPSTNNAGAGSVETISHSVSACVTIRNGPADAWLKTQDMETAGN